MISFVLGGGCFWCLDAVYRQIKGVTDVVSGYAGGEGTPNYYRVATGETGYAEVVRVTFDEVIVPADVVLDLFFIIHDPTTLNRQGADVGTQYRSAMFYQDSVQQKEFQEALERAKKVWDDTIVTEVVPLETFYPAEEEHQDYFHKNPESGYCSIVIEPKITKTRAHFKQWFKEETA
jgi:peptide-methionine (S)-S-oxide reductase